MSQDLSQFISEARDPRTFLNRLWELFDHPEVEVRQALLQNPNLCTIMSDGTINTVLMAELAKEFPEEVAKHPLFMLQALIEPTTEMIFVAEEVLKNTSDVGLIQQLFKMYCAMENMRIAVAKNKNTPVDILRCLGDKNTETSWRVRREIASNPSTPEDLLRALGNPENEPVDTVRREAYLNPKTPVDILQLYSNKAESDSCVRAVAKDTLGRRVAAWNKTLSRR